MVSRLRKIFIPLVILSFLCIEAQSQGKYNTRKWFYNLPLQLTSKDIIEAIRSNPSFKEVMYDSLPTDYKTPFFSAQILRPHLYRTAVVDSASLKIYKGYRHDNKVQKMKLIAFEYFIKDTFDLEDIYSDGRVDLEVKSKRDIKSFHFPENKPYYGKGYIYVYSKKPLVIASIWINYYDDGKRSLRILSESPDH